MIKKFKELQSIITIFTSIIGLVGIGIDHVVTWSLFDYTLFFIPLGISILVFLIWQIYSSCKSLNESIIYEKDVMKNLRWFATSALSTAFFFYLLFHRAYYFASFIGFVNLSLILSIMVILILFILAYSLKGKKLRNISDNNNRKKVLVFSLLILCFTIPLFVGIAIPLLLDPGIEVSPLPRYIYYESGLRYQEVKTADIFIKAIEGYAWNVRIFVEPPQELYILVDGVVNGTKIIRYIEFERVESFYLNIQPSPLTSNGTYAIPIHWTYESASGYISKKSTLIWVLIGSKPQVVFIIPGIAIMTLVLSVFTLRYLFKRKLIFG